MRNQKYVPVQITGAPKLTMRYYKTDEILKGILVFIHGVSHGAWCWENFAEYFTKKGYACFVINLRKHGDNPSKGINLAALSAYVKDTTRCIHDIKNHCGKPEINIPYRKPYIIGHSMGGAIVEMYLSKHSDKVKGAVLFAPATAQGMGKSIFTTTLTKTGYYTMPTTIGLKQNKHLAKSNFFVAKDNNKEFTPRITDAEKLEYYNKQLCKESLPAMLGLMKFEMNTVPIPVFVIGSDKDAYFPTDSLNTTANFYDTKPMILRGLCHDMMLDPDWEDAAWSVLQFIEKPDDLKNDSHKFIHYLKEKLYPSHSK